MSRSPDLERKLDVLMSLATDDREGLPPRLRHARSTGALNPVNIRHLRPMPGMRMSLLRILMTNACSFNCHYCPMRRDREMPRTLLKPEELVRIFLGARARGWCEGLFVTTGIPGRPVKVMDDLIAALELLRERHRFGGYIHVKLVPGAEPAQIERLTQLASRVSVNLEAPCGASLASIAPEKSFAAAVSDLERVRGQLLRERAERAQGRPGDALHPGGVSGMTMQFVVGATDDTDRMLLDTVGRLSAGGGIHHAHFSAFRPIENTPLEGAPAAPALREHRLYQADHLMRSYGFQRDEVVFEPTGNLPLAVDPKTAWAIAHPERFPIEIRTAPPEELLRVPGIGPTSARRIVAERGKTVFRTLADLRKIGVVTNRAAGFITLSGKRLQTARWTQQLGFWAPEEEVGVPHLVYQVSPGTFR
ncbi:MAG TPA: radical SAM protein [Gemmatimonadales bacterium]|jgi:predicted DNA-binding helix-hairpin-helix protein